ncbi:VanW family protein [Macrococcus psychrotolerans]|uniref:VanW family protein n=1 Tax=Macrococcus psychrotolerans TaxID=3039389 RepID=A0AAU6RJ46_9STAP
MTKHRKLFSEIHPVLYALSVQKERLKRQIQNRKKIFASIRIDDKLPNVIYSYHSNLIKKGKGIDPKLQYNKAFNIDKSARTMNGLIIRPGEEFSFWYLVGNANKQNGYKDGRVIINNKLQAGAGGGLCNLANTINLLIQHSPLEVTEFHMHSDALALEEVERKPLRNGTSVAYNYVDYRFRNTTNQNVQLCVWVEDKKLYGELRSEQPIKNQYELIEENHHYIKQGDKFYRRSMIYKLTKNTDGEIISKDLILKNKSEVMFDYDLIPKELIK